MALEYFPCYHSYRKKTEKLTDEELGRLFRALLAFSETGEQQELSGRESIAFDFIAEDIARARASYEAKCRKNAVSAGIRWHANGCERMRTDANDANLNLNKTKDKEKENKEKGGLNGTSLEDYTVQYD